MRDDIPFPLGEPTDESVGRGVHFERIRRITGYLVGDLSRFNDAKRAEERERVKHASMELLSALYKTA